MPFDGNGNFELLRDFRADRDAGFPSNRILAELMMDMFEDVAGGLETAAVESAARLTGTSTSSVAIGTGSKTFTTQANKAFAVGRWVLIASNADTANYMHGQVTSYSSTTLQVDVTNIGGSGTLADWTITISGTRGGAGTIGATGPGYAATSTTSLATAGTGSKTFTTQAGLAYTVGARIRATSVGTGEWMEGLVTSYSGTSLEVTMDLNSGTGTHADWNINLAGERGEAGSGTGDFVGPGSSVDGHAVLFDGTTGKLGKSAGAAPYIVGGTDVAIADGGTGESTAAGAFDALKQAATDAYAGVVGLALAAEITAGSDPNLVVTPAAFAESDFGKTVVGIVVFDDSQDVAVGDGAGDVFFRIPAVLNGYNLVAVAAQVQTAGTTGTTDIQIRNVTQAADMLTTKITLDSTETDSSTAATPAVIDTGNDDVATGDQIRIDVDATATTKARGLYVELTFQLP